MSKSERIEKIESSELKLMCAIVFDTDFVPVLRYRLYSDNGLKNFFCKKSKWKVMLYPSCLDFKEKLNIETSVKILNLPTATIK